MRLPNKITWADIRKAHKLLNDQSVPRLKHKGKSYYQFGMSVPQYAELVGVRRACREIVEAREAWWKEMGL